MGCFLACYIVYFLHSRHLSWYSRVQAERGAASRFNVPRLPNPLRKNFVQITPYLYSILASQTFVAF
ncbi:hypothetical protein M407DRAFT_116217 [Tulasnella calospora MUT 4182]|uniref:Uncharacterized protein n=1 Tax=Tulasnella calospora MUT 4182 TaxID=1051891 RepID=A0A0C3KMZ6_9AGAM|nr:hypothetical protein M407DRAFT_116217 [Tulasnella calospora MUT 4182]